MIDQILSKLKEYEEVFGKDNICLLLWADGTGATGIGRRCYYGYFQDGFDDIHEFLQKDPKVTKQQAIAWGWMK